MDKLFTYADFQISACKGYANFYILPSLNITYVKYENDDSYGIAFAWFVFEFFIRFVVIKNKDE